MNSLQELLTRHQDRILFKCIAGSHAYGTQHESSDQDVRGVFISTMQEYVSLEGPTDQFSDERSDIVYYSLRRFLELLTKSNPNAIELLYTPEDCVLLDSEFMKCIREERSSFISKKAFDTFVGYAHSQVKKAKGQNMISDN